MSCEEQPASASRDRAARGDLATSGEHAASHRWRRGAGERAADCERLGDVNGSVAERDEHAGGADCGRAGDACECETARFGFNACDCRGARERTHANGRLGGQTRP